MSSFLKTTLPTVMSSSGTLLANSILSSPPYMMSQTYLGAGHVYAPYIPMVISTPIFVTIWTVPEWTDSKVFPWEVGNLVEYKKNIWLILDVKFQDVRGRWFNIRALDGDGKETSLQTSTDLVWRSAPITVLNEESP